MNEQTPEPQWPDLSFQTNQRWAIKLAFFWSLLMVPSNIANLKGEGGMELILTCLGMVGFFILMFRGILTITNGVSLYDLRMQGMKWHVGCTLWLGMCAWFFVFSVFFLTVTISFLGPSTPAPL